MSYLQQRRGTCEPAGAGKGCRVVREVTRRYYVDDQVQSTARTTFTVDIELNSDGEPARVSIDRYDLYGSEHDL